jgi:hypothetical protein
LFFFLPIIDDGNDCCIAIQPRLGDGRGWEWQERIDTETAKAFATQIQRTALLREKKVWSHLRTCHNHG